MKVNVFIIILFSIGGSLYAQNMNHVNSEVMFDPTFWKHNLRLSKEQYFAINEINSEFYNSLILAIHQVMNAKDYHISTELVSQRTKLIWELLSPRQKSKWKKISRSFNWPMLEG